LRSFRSLTRVRKARTARTDDVDKRCAQALRHWVISEIYLPVVECPHGRRKVVPFDMYPRKGSPSIFSEIFKVAPTLRTRKHADGAAIITWRCGKGGRKTEQQPRLSSKSRREGLCTHGCTKEVVVFRNLSTVHPFSARTTTKQVRKSRPPYVWCL
jgi:hypothetical protein